MKRFICAVVLLSVLLSGCSTPSSHPVGIPNEAGADIAADSTTATVPEPETEATLSPEELFLQTLPDRVRSAYEIGLVDLDILEDLERPCTTAEAAAILQNICQQKFGQASWMVEHAFTEETGQQPLTRGWFMTMMYAADAESLVGVKTEDYAANLRDLTCTTNTLENEIADALLGLVGNTGYVMVETDTGEMQRHISAYGEFRGAAGFVADLEDFDGDIVIVSYALTRFDRRNGDKLMTWDADKKLHFNAPMSVQEVVETALRYYHALEPKPNMVPYEDTLPYDETIITPELLAKEITLPDASCTHLPKEWHGIDLYNNVGVDEMIYKHELQAIKDAGFNFIRYSFDNTFYHGRAPEEGKMNENRLKELDQILAWCMELDIHLSLTCDWSYDWPDAFSDYQLVEDPANAQGLANFWKALAKRYADIPNNYLSFTMLNRCWGRNDQDIGVFLGYIADEIRQEDPNRCLIARVGLYGITGRDIAAHGIALSSENVHGEDFYFPYSKIEQAKHLMQNATWPYTEDGKTVDAESNMTTGYKDPWSWYPHSAPDEIAAIAKENNVGYMIYRWGPRNMDNSPIVEPDRYSDETMYAYLTNMVQTMDERGYGWCYTEMMSSLGIGFLFPVVETTTYTQIENYPLYIDNEMTAWFREINKVN